ncbi:hypothetical protein BJ742DRAFT_854883 [Cladochytrium replicatum]|nr:hypothetical protein BJ742DRAFT_854883 [Cladochytrium replicatum]
MKFPFDDRLTDTMSPNKRPAEEDLDTSEVATSSSGPSGRAACAALNPRKRKKRKTRYHNCIICNRPAPFLLSRRNFSKLAPHVAQRMRSHVAYSDWRVIPLPSAKDAMETVFWRSHLDGIRNAISAMAQAKFSAKQLCKEKLRMLSDAGVESWTTFSPRAFFGTLVKKESSVLENARDP